MPLNKIFVTISFTYTTRPPYQQSKICCTPHSSLSAMVTFMCDVSNGFRSSETDLALSVAHETCINHGFSLIPSTLNCLFGCHENLISILEVYREMLSGEENLIKLLNLASNSAVSHAKMLTNFVQGAMQCWAQITAVGFCQFGGMIFLSICINSPRLPGSGDQPVA